MKDWIYRKFISKGLLELKEESRQKGYDQAIADIKKECQEKVDFYKNRYEELQKEWFVDPVDVITVTEKGILQLNGEQISEVEAKSLKAEVKTLKSFRLWNILNNTLRQKAIEKSVLQSTNFEQVLAGKMMVHNLGVIKSIIDVIDKHIIR